MKMARGEINRCNSLPVNCAMMCPWDRARRRNGMAYIFEDQSPRDVKQIMERYRCTRRASLCTDNDNVFSKVTKSNEVGNSNAEVDSQTHVTISDGNSQRKRNCDGVFQTLINNDYVQSLSAYLNSNSNQEEFNDTLDEAEHPTEKSGYYHTKQRRCALADIFENVDEHDLVHILALYSHMTLDSKMDTFGFNRQRRNAVPNVFAGISEEDHETLLTKGSVLNNSSFEIDLEDEDFLKVKQFRQSRRAGMADIFDNVSLKDRYNLINNFEHECHDDEKDDDDDDLEVTMSLMSRRLALPDVFVNVTQADLDNLRVKYSNKSAFIS